MIGTDRLILVRPEIAHYESYRRLWGPENQGEFGPPPLNPEECWARLLRWIGHWSAFGFGPFFVEDRAEGSMIGEGGYGDFHRGLGSHFDGVPEAGWKLAREWRGRGLATEAMTAATRWTDETVRPDRTVCMINPANAPSFGVAAKLGFTRFGEVCYRDQTLILLERHRERPLPPGGHNDLHHRRL